MNFRSGSRVAVSGVGTQIRIASASARPSQNRSLRGSIPETFISAMRSAPKWLM